MRKVATILLFISIFVAVDYFNGGKLRDSVRASAGQLVAVSAGAYESISESPHISSKRALSEENAKLKEQLESLRLLRLENDLLRAENAALKDIANVSETRAVVSARIVSSPGASPYGTLRVSAGEYEGVSIGDIVTLGGRVALGKITNVGAHSSLMTLYSAPGVQSDVRVADTSAVLSGRGGGNAKMELPRDIEVADGDLVMLSGTGLLVGTIGKIDDKPSEAIRSILVAVPVNLTALDFVTILSGE